ncbi:MAG: HAD-IA family hydrolase [Nitrospirota bacterium]
MPIELIIFDLDGTLVDSSRDIANAVNHAIAPYGVQPLTVKETIGLIGEGVTRLMEKVIAKEHLNAGRDALVDRFLAYYAEHLVDETTVYPGVRETLEQLTGCRKAVISNKREALSVKILEKLALAKYLDIIVGSDTTEERKPSPLPILYVLDRFGINARDAVMVGDSNYDIEAGKAAGIRTVSVTYGYKTLDFLRGSDFIIESMFELPGILERME